MKTGIDKKFLTSWPWKVSQDQVQGQLSKNAQNGQKSHQKASGEENIQILHWTLTQLLKVIPKKGL